MKEADFSEILRKANDCYDKKKKWHFHVLTPACMYNPGKTFSILFENEENNEHLVSRFDEKPLEQAEELEALFYGRV